MRRALLTATPSVSLTVGNTGTFGTTSAGVRLIIDAGPATASGTVTSVTAHLLQARTDLVVFTGSLSGSNFTVRAASPALSGSVGVNVFAVSLAVQAGDLIGYWAGSTAFGSYGGSGASVYALTTSAPTVGAVIATFGFTGRISILGTS